VSWPGPSRPAPRSGPGASDYCRTALTCRRSRRSCWSCRARLRVSTSRCRARAAGRPRYAVRRRFDRAAAYFGALAARAPADPHRSFFQAGAYIWWAVRSRLRRLRRCSASTRCSLSAGTRACRRPERRGLLLATALGYPRGNAKEHGHGYGAAKTRRPCATSTAASSRPTPPALTAISDWACTTTACGAPARLPDSLRASSAWKRQAERGIRSMRRAAQDGDLARVESTWVLAAALTREAGARSRGRAVLERERAVTSRDSPRAILVIRYFSVLAKVPAEDLSG